MEDFPYLLSRKTVSFLISLGVYEKQDDDLEIVEYGLTLFFSSILKAIFVLLIALLFGLVKEVIICAVAFGILRTFAGGVHAKTSLGCLISMIVTYFTTIFLSRIIPYSDKLIYFSFAACLIVLILYAPADVAEKPILCGKQKLRFKLYSLVILVLLYALSLFYFKEEVSKLIVISCVLECITLLPLTYKVIKTKGGDCYEKEMV